MVSSFEEGTCHLPIFILCVPIVLLASKCLACQLPTPGIDIHLCQTIPLTTEPKISTVSLSISNGLPKKCSFPIISSWSMSHLPLKQKLKKNWTKKHWKKEKEKGDKIHTSVQESWKKRSSNKMTKCFLSVSSFPPSPLNILPSLRSGFDRVPTSCEPFFGSVTQITNVCHTLPTQNSTYQP